MAVFRHIDKLSTRFNASLKGNFARDFSKVFSGNIVAQILLISATPIITRLYSPEAFGGMAFISSWIGVLAVVSCLRYDQAIILPKNDLAAHNLAALSLFILIGLFGLGLVIAIPITFLGETYSAYFGLFWLVPIGAMFTGLKDILFAWSTRRKLFGALAVAQVVAATVSIGFKLVYGFVFSPDAEGLLIGNIIGLIAGAILLIASIWSAMPLFGRHVSLPEIKRQASEYAKFPKFATLNGLLNVVSQNLPVFLLGFLFSPQIVGFYGLGNAVLRKPVQTVGVSISRVFVQRASVYQARRADMRPILFKATLGLGILGLLPFLLILTYGDILFVIVFGPEWLTAGIYCQILTPWLFMLFINPPATQILIVKQDLQFNLNLMIVSIIARGASIMAGVIFFDSILVSLTLFSISGVLLNLFYIRRAFMLCNH